MAISRGKGVVKAKNRALKRLPKFLDDLDALDFAIINLLQTNGRMTNIEIARNIGVTEATARRRVERLTASKIIKVTAVVDPRKTGYVTDAIIGISVEPGTVLRVAAALARLPEVVYLAYTTGPYDLTLETLFRSDEDLFRFLSKELPQVKGVRSTVTFHVLRTEKTNYDWKLPHGAAEHVARNGRLHAK
jgi:Lrp/AsnC family transcriptional regulator for asnA, asnC and gidA